MLAAALPLRGVLDLAGTFVLAFLAAAEAFALLVVRLVLLLLVAFLSFFLSAMRAAFLVRGGAVDRLEGVVDFFELVLFLTALRAVVLRFVRFVAIFFTTFFLATFFLVGFFVPPAARDFLGALFFVRVFFFATFVFAVVCLVVLLRTVFLDLAMRRGPFVLEIGSDAEHAWIGPGIDLNAQHSDPTRSDKW